MTILTKAARLLIVVAAAATPFVPAPAGAAPAPAAVAGPVTLPAGPVAQASGLCTVGEWQNPGNFTRCVAELKGAVTDQIDCHTAPVPDTPDSGVAGWFIHRPDEDLQPGVGGRYTRYGLGGYHLATYDLGTAPTCAVTHPIAAGESETASMEFAAASAIIGAANGIRDDAYHPADLWAWSDPFITDTTQAVYHHVFSVFGILMLAFAGLTLIWQARAGNLSQAMHVVGWALIVMIATTAVARWPIRAVHGAETVAGTGLSVIHSVVGPPSQTIPADQCPQPDPAGCIDHRSASTRASDTITDAVLYRSWLRAELGSADSPTAKKYGAALYDAATLTWADQDTLAKNPDQRAVVVAQKNDQWTTIAAQIKTEDPQAYENLQGLDGTSRIGAGFIALSSAVVYAGFDIIASLVILFGFVVFLFAVMLAPLFATWGIWLPASGGFRRLVNAVIAATFNIILFGFVAGLYLRLVTVITSIESIPGAVQFVVIGCAGIGCALLLHPLRKLTAGIGLARPDGSDHDNGRRLRDWLRTAATAAATAANAATATGGPAAGATTTPATGPSGGTHQQPPVRATVVVDRPESRTPTARADAHRPPVPAAIPAARPVAAITARPEIPSRTGGPS